MSFLFYTMIKAVIFDLDNTLLDFMGMKTMAIDAALNGMIEAGMVIRRITAREKIFEIYLQNLLIVVHYSNKLSKVV